MPETSLTYLPYYKSTFDFGFGIQGAHLEADCNLRITDAVGGTNDLDNLVLTLRGPGHIIGINKNMIARVEPVAGSQDFEPNYFPFIESVDPDLFWRYSLGNINDKEQVVPWLQLIVISFDEVNAMIMNDHKEVFRNLDDEKELLTVNKKYLSNLDKAWATAHVQLTNTDKDKFSSDVGDGTYVENFIRTKASQHNSRLMCMRKLEPETHYFAILCPTYKAALNAYKNEDPDVVGTSLLWDKNDEDDWIEIPIYYKWEFMTSEKGDFESLARELKPSSVDDKPVGTRVVDLGEQSADDVDENLYFRREGAIAKPGFSLVRENYTSHIKDLPFPDTSVYPKMKDELNESLQSFMDDDDDDPFITYPVYGRHFRNTQAIEDPGDVGGRESWPAPTPWVHELNLDMRNRVAGGFGTNVIQQNQESYMKQCWDQVGDVRLANELLRRTKAGSLNATKLKEKHLDKLNDRRFTLISYPFHSHFVQSEEGASKSLKLTLKDSGLQPGISLPAFRHVGHKYVGIEKLDIFKNWDIAKENDETERNKSKIWNRLKCVLFQLIIYTLYLVILSLRRIPALSFISGLILKLMWWLKKVFKCNFASGLKIPRSPNTFTYDIEQFKKKYSVEDMDLPIPGGEILPAKAEVIQVNPIDIANDFRPKFDHKKVLKKKIDKIIKPNSNLIIPENFDPILTWPYIRDPIYKELSKLSNDYVLPGIEYLDNNGVTIMEENPRFIESIMCPVNHEMGRELVWREFPTDQMGTIFTQFWDPTQFIQSETEDTLIPKPDISAIHTWNKKLGLNYGDKEPNLVLVIKGDLIRRYPDTIIYCHKINRLEGDAGNNEYKFWSDLYKNEEGELINPPIPDANSLIIEPVFRAQMGQDIIFAGFPFTLKDIQGDSRDGEYYFVLQENRDLPRYGLDLATRNSCLQSPDDDLHWGQTDAENNEGYICTFSQGVFGINEEIHSATVAKKTYQRPVRVAFHSSTLLKSAD